MPEIYELPESGRFDGEKYEWRGQIDGYASAVDARWQLLLASSPTYHGLQREAVSVEPTENPLLWTGIVTYAKAPRRVGDVEFSWRIGSESGPRTHNIAYRGVYSAPGFTAPNFQGAIGVERHGNELAVRGVNVDYPTLEFSIKLRADPSVFTTEYAQAIYGVKTAPVNNAPFWGFAAHEVRLLGVEGGYRSGEEYGELTFHFAASPNAANLSVGHISGITKYGWDYLDVYFLEELDAAAKAIVKVPKAVYCHQVYAESNFAALGLG